MNQEITKNLPFAYKLFLIYRRVPSIIIIIGSLFSLFYISNKFKDFDGKEWVKLNFNTATIKGVITDISYSGVTESYSNDDETYYYDIMAYQYEYNVLGETHRWTSYSKKNRLKIGSKVAVKINKNNPAYSILTRGSSKYRYLPNGSPIGWLIIPLILFGLLCYHGYKAIYFNGIIKNGVLTKARLKHKQQLSSDENTFIQYKLVFTYKTINNHQHQLTIKSYFIDKFTDERKREFLIYNKHNPKKALLVDDLPGVVAKYIKKNWA